MKVVRIVLAGLTFLAAFAACSSQAPAPAARSGTGAPSIAPVAPGNLRVEFEGSVDVARRTMSVVVHAPSGALHTEATLPYGPGEVYFHTCSVAWDPVAMTLTGAVQAINQMSGIVGNLNATIDGVTPTGVSPASGTIASYGTTQPNTADCASTQTWTFHDPTGGNFTFRGHADGTPPPSGATVCDASGPLGPSVCAAATTSQTCYREDPCTWDANAGKCVVDPCRNCTSAECTDPACSLYDTPNIQPPACLGHGCNAATSACACVQTAGCIWKSTICIDTRLSACAPNTDYVIGYLRAVSSSRASPKALEDLKKWVGGLPLSGAKLGAAADPSTSRVAVYVLGATAPVATVSGSPFSSNIVEINNMFRTALGKTPTPAGKMGSIFTTAKNVATDGTRRHVLILIADEAPQDKPLPSFSTISGFQVMWLLPSADPQSVSTAPFAPVASQPTADNVLPIFAGDATTTLAGTCDFGHPLFSQVTTEDCSRERTRDVCVLNPYCDWDFAQNACVPTVCLGYCNLATCSDDTGCASSGSACQKIVRCGEIPTICTPDPAGDEMQCGAANQSDCTSSASFWHPTYCAWNAQAQSCGATDPCIENDTQASCLADPTHCKWDPQATTMFGRCTAL